MHAAFELILVFMTMLGNGSVKVRDLGLLFPSSLGKAEWKMKSTQFSQTLTPKIPSLFMTQVLIEVHKGKEREANISIFSWNPYVNFASIQSLGLLSWT